MLVVAAALPKEPEAPEERVEVRRELAVVQLQVPLLLILVVAAALLA
jgi:hypothetical protein